MKKLCFLMIFVFTACMSDQQFNEKLTKALKENPEILAGAIKENSTEVFQALQNAAQHAQKEMAQKREEDRKKELLKYYDNPLTPNIRDTENFKGSKDAPLVLVEYSDFECPFCSRAYKTVEDIMRKYNGKVKFIYKHLPLDFHKNAMIAAKYYEAVRIQDGKKAWKLHDKILSEQKVFSRGGESYLKKAAKTLSVNMSKLKKDLSSKVVMDRIEEDIKEAKSFGITGTPGFVLNGIPVKGAYPVEYFDQIIGELKKRGKVTL